IRDRLGDAPARGERFLWGGAASVCLAGLVEGTTLGGHTAQLAGRSVLIAPRDQLAAALALVELDGIAGRVIICPPDLPAEHLPEIVAKASVEAIVSDRPRAVDEPDVPLRVLCDGSVTSPDRLQKSPTVGAELTRPDAFARPDTLRRRATEWVLLTSGTTGVPKMLVHSVATLT